MTDATKPNSQDSLSLWRFIFAPMLLVSLVLHGVMLTIPLPESTSKPMPTPSPQKTEQVKVAKLAALIPPKPKPKLPPKPTPKLVKPRPKLQQPKPQQPPLPPPVPPPVVKASPPPAPVSEPSPKPAPEDPPPSQADQEFQDFFGQFQENLGTVGANDAELGIPYYLFAQPELFFTAESLAASEATQAQPETLAGVENILWISLRRPDDLYEELQALYEGFTFTEANEYGGGTVYKVNKGKTTRFINLVRAKDKTATFVVIWHHDPNTRPDPTP